MSSETQAVHESGLVSCLVRPQMYMNQDLLHDTSPDSCTAWVSLDMIQVLIHVQLGSH
jgi:hypothetical protein